MRLSGSKSRLRQRAGTTGEARPGKMITHVTSPALPDLRPALQLAGPARPIASVQEHGTAGAAARGRRPAPEESAAPPGLGRPGGTGPADPAPAQTPARPPPSHAPPRSTSA